MGKRILVVDDEEVVLGAVCKALRKDDYDIDTVLSAGEALKLMSASSYAVVITDLMMPEIDGLELLEHIRKIGAETQTIMITGYPTIKTALRAKRLGAFEYVTKPFTRQELRSVVVRAIRSKSNAQTPGESSQPSGSGDETYHIPDHSWAKRETDGTFRIGIARSIANSVGKIEYLHLPETNDYLEQGKLCVILRAADGVEHYIHSPLSGKVMEINDKLIEEPGLVIREPEEHGWLILIEPLNLEKEIANLVPSDSPSI